jgi:hypothetical protein
MKYLNKFNEGTVSDHRETLSRDVVLGYLDIEIEKANRSSI